MQLIILCLALPWVICLSSCGIFGSGARLRCWSCGFSPTGLFVKHTTYATHRKSYISFCYVMGYTPVPATTEVLAHYAAVLARSLKYQSVKQFLIIVKIFVLNGIWIIQWQIIQMQYVICGIRRSPGDTQKHKGPITPDLLLKILSKLDLDLQVNTAFWAV